MIYTSVSPGKHEQKTFSAAFDVRYFIRKSALKYQHANEVEFTYTSFCFAYCKITMSNLCKVNIFTILRHMVLLVHYSSGLLNINHA